MRRVLRSVIICLSSFVVLLVQFLSVLPAPVQAVTPYEASDVLGQPNFTNNRPYGELAGEDTLRYPSYTAVDSTHHRLFVSDTSNNRVLVFNLDSNNDPIDSTADYVLGQADFQGSNSHVTVSGLNNPQGLAYDSTNDRLFIADTNNNRVLIFDTSTITNNEDAINVLGQSNFTTGGAYIALANTIYNPVGIAFDSTNSRLFVVDMGHHRVLVFDTSTITNNEDAVKVLGQANLATGYTYNYDTNAKGFYNPQGIAYDSMNNRLFVSDTSNSRVLIFDTTTITNNEDAVNVLGQADFTSGGYDTNAKGFSYPRGLTYDSTNNHLFVADTNNHRVLIFDTTTITNNEDAVYVLGQADFTSGGADINAKDFYNLQGIAYDSMNNRLFVSDTSNSRVLIFDITTITNNEDAVSVLGQSDYTSGSPNRFSDIPNSTGIGGGGYGASTSIDTVHHRLFVSDGSSYRILVFNLDSNNNLVDHTADHVLGCESLTSTNCYYQTHWFYYPGSLAYDSVHDRLFVFDGYDSRVIVYDTATITDGEEGIVTIGQDDPSASATDTTADRFGGGGDEYGGIAYDETSQYLYVTDLYNNNRVLVFDVSPEHIATGMDASYVLGASDFTSVGAGGCNSTGDISSSDGYGGGIAVDTVHHQLFVENYYCYNILVFDVSNIANGMSPIHYLGCYDFGGNYTGNDTYQSCADYVFGMAYDPAQGLLYAYDEDYARISIFDANEITDGEPAIGVLGQPDFSSSSTGVSQTEINPYWYIGDFAFDSTNRRLYFPDDYNSRVLIFSFAHLPETLSNPTLNTSYSTRLNDYSQGTTTFSVTSGSLPSGMSLDSSTGVLSGTPTAPGSYSFTVSLSDDNGTAGIFTDSQAYTFTISNDGPKPDGENSTTEAPSCNDQVASAPDLFQLDRSGTTATVHFAPLSDSVSSYLISYGTDSTAEGYSVELPISHADGAVSQDIHDLNPSSSYSFKVRAQKGCMPGDWSSVKEASIQRSYTTISSSPVYQSTPSTSSKKTTIKQPTKKTIKKTTKPPKKKALPSSSTSSKPKICLLLWCW